MIFKKKTLQDELLIRINNLEKDIRDKVIILLFIFIYLKENIEKKVVVPFNATHENKLTELQEEIINYFIIHSIIIQNFYKYEILKIYNENEIDVNGLLYYKNSIAFLFANRFNNDANIKNINNYFKAFVDNNPDFAFLQMMTKIYSLEGKEYTNELYEKYKIIHDSIIEISTRDIEDLVATYQENKHIAVNAINSYIKHFPDGLITTINSLITWIIDNIKSTSHSKQ